jgi:uncharacterized protein (DUF1800 family)
MASPFEPLPAAQWTPAAATHLMWRAGFGGTPDEIKALHALGLDGAVDSLLAQAKAEPERLPAELERAWDLWRAAQDERKNPNLDEAAKLELEYKMNGIRNRAMQRLPELWLERLLTTTTPFREKLALYWHDHFSVMAEKVQDPVALWRHADLLRTHGLDDFGHLLLLISQDAAMLKHLDNVNSVKGRPNENYARELMELFTVGIGQYTEEDVRASARAFTGWTYNRETYEFTLREEQHDKGEKTFLGRTGPWTGNDIIRILLEQPASSRFLARKLWLWFAQDNPPDATVNALARVIRREEFRMGAVFRALFRSKAFYEPAVVGTQVKTPVQFVVGTVRLMKISPPVPVLAEASRIMGQKLFDPPDVNGWPKGDKWINTSTLLVRYNFANYLVTGKIPGTRPGAGAKGEGTDFKPEQFVDPKRGDNAEAVTDAFIAWFVQRPLHSKLRNQLVAYLRTDRNGAEGSFNVKNNDAPEKLRALVHLILSSPDYQLC